MNRLILSTFFLTLLIFLTSCGAEKLNKPAVASYSGMSDASCACNSSGPPVCGDGIEYNNACYASCYGARSVQVGHCDCSNHTVCASDGRNYNECVAKRDQSIYIVKYIPCEAQEY